MSNTSAAHNIFHGLPGLTRQHNAALHSRDRGADQVHDLLSHCSGMLRQAAQFGGHYGKAAALLVGA